MKILERREVLWMENRPFCKKCRHLMIFKNYDTDLKSSIFKCPNPNCNIELTIKGIY